MDVNDLTPENTKYRSSGKEGVVNANQEQLVKRERVGKVITGSAKIQKKPITKRFLETFLAGDVRDVKQYILMDVMVPAIKDTISDILTKGIEMMIFGETKSSSAKKKTSGGGTYVSYGSAFREKSERLPSYRNRMSHEFDDIVFETRGDAETVLDSLGGVLEKYEQVTVADFYDLCEISITWADDAEKWGWTDLRNAYVSRAGRDGYIINLPKPIKL